MVETTTINSGDVAEIRERYHLPEEYQPDGKFDEAPPKSDREKAFIVLDDNPELRENAMNSRHGYREALNEAIKDRWGEWFGVDVHYISTVVAQYREERKNAEPEPDLGPTGDIPAEPPSVARKRVRTLIENDPEARQALLQGERGYRDLINDRMAEYWGEEHQVDLAYISGIASKIRREWEEEDEAEDDAEAGDETQITDFDDSSDSAAEAESEADEDDDEPGEIVIGDELIDPIDEGAQFDSAVERAKHVIRSDEGLMREVAEKAQNGMDQDEARELLQRIKDATKERFGVNFIPTAGSVRTAIIELRDSGLLPTSREKEEFPRGEGPKKIVYECNLCDYEHSNYRTVVAHIARSDDAVHRDRTGKEVHLINKRGEDIDDTHDAFRDSQFRGEFSDGFDVLWSIYTNPDSPQSDIAEMLGISTPTLKRRLEQLDIDWKQREQQVNELLSSWNRSDSASTDEDEIEAEAEAASADTESAGSGSGSGERVTTKRGNASYSGSATGLDATMRSIQESRAANPNLPDPATEPEADQTVTVELGLAEAQDLLCGDGELAKRRVLAALMGQ